jgi:asparagine synthase (glutamine-hydrolysing)
VLCVVDGRPRTERLAADLGLDPATPPGRAIAEGYALIGGSLLKRLRGEFALLVWSEAEQRGLLARDGGATRPLFLAARGDALHFASEVRNLLPLLPGRPAPDAVAMAHWLARAAAPDERTLFDGIVRLAPGAAVRLGPGRWTPFRFWEPRPAPPLELGPEDAAAALREALGAAVDRSLRGARSPGVMLSGGLDSAVVAAVAAPAAGSLTAHSGVFPQAPEVDESARIRRVRDWLGLEGVEAELGSGSALEAADEFTREWHLPSPSPNRFVWKPLLAGAAAGGTDVLLDGEGGDELFGCARYLVADRLRGGRLLAAARTARRLPGMGADPRPRWIGRALAVYGARGALPPALHERLRGARGSAGGPGWLAAPVADDRWAWKSRRGPRWWAHLASMLAGDRLGAADHQRREAAMHGLELRHPLRDPELAGLVLRLPPELGFDPHVDRPLVRRALARELPADVLGPARKPFFNVLLETALAGPDRERLRELLGDPRPELAALVRTGALRDLLEDPRGPAALDLWRLATLELWLRRAVVG